jgi:hypothetical protein
MARLQTNLLRVTDPRAAGEQSDRGGAEGQPQRHRSSGLVEYA